MTIADRVAKGIALLDEKGPENWRDSIDLESLDMSSPGHCILGQLYPGFLKALAALGISESTYQEGPMPEEFGFDFAEDDDEYDSLQEEWLLQLSVVRD